MENFFRLVQLEKWTEAEKLMPSLSTLTSENKAKAHENLKAMGVPSIKESHSEGDQVWVTLSFPKITMKMPVRVQNNERILGGEIRIIQNIPSTSAP